LRYAAGKCPIRWDPTIEDAYRKIMIVDGRSVTLDILDTAGQAEYVGLMSEYIAEGEGFVLVYSITDNASFAEVEVFKERLEEQLPAGAKAPLCLVGNKIDCELDQRQVPMQQGVKLAERWKTEASDKIGEIRFLEASAMAGINVNETFEELVRMIMATKSKAKQNNMPSRTATKQAQLGKGASCEANLHHTSQESEQLPKTKGLQCQCVMQ